MRELWKDIPGYVGIYQISNLGSIKSLVRKGRRTEIILDPGMDSDGYLHTSLRKNNIGVPRQVHRLVLETFIGPRPCGMVTRHLDGNRRNNKLDNLAWGTVIENAQDAVRHGTSPGFKSYGTNNGQSKLTESKVVKIKRLLGLQEYSQRKIAQMFDVSFHTISLIKLGKTWKHV